MNLQASEEVLSVAEVTETNQVTVGTVTTSATDTQAVGGVSAYYRPLPTSYTPQQSLPNYGYRSSGYQQSFAAYQEYPINFNRTDFTSPPTKAQETYNINCMNDHANHVARRACEKGWISKATVKRIFHRGLGESFDGYRDGFLAAHYIDNMINYGKFYKYLSGH